MLNNYDNWLLNQADEYYSECMPAPVNVDYEFEGYDEDGSPINTPQYTYNCEGCEHTDCEHWDKYNNKE